MRRRIVAGNWKMNLTLTEATELVKQLEAYAILNPIEKGKEIILAPPFVYLEGIVNQLVPTKGIKVAAQNCHHEAKGAFTGEVSAAMLKSIAVAYVIIGHSERRAYFTEQEEVLYQKLKQALSNGLSPIFCVGENETDREKNRYEEVVAFQLKETLFKLEVADFEKCIIAYEPVWAIGTGKTASPQQAQDMHYFIRSLISQQFGDSVAAEMSILYGGSCNPKNAAELFAQSDVDGGLIGGASLKFEDFISIFHAFEK
jgi:triosephosphate isomerase